MNILDIGTHIENRLYNQVHSRFADVVNFYNHDEIGLSLVSKKIGGGPVNIVVDNFNLFEINSAEISDNYISINSQKPISLNISRTDYSLPEINSDIFFKNLNALKNCILQHSPEKSLAVLLNQNRENYFTSTIEKHLLTRYIEAFSYYDNNDIETSVKIFKGLGFGQTPSGDDFNAGLLMGLNVIDSINKKHSIELINRIFELAKGSNCISNLLLYICKKGMCSQKFLEVIHALSNRDFKQMELTIKDYISIGETSGADFLTGFYFTVRCSLTSSTEELFANGQRPKAKG